MSFSIGVFYVVFGIAGVTLNLAVAIAITLDPLLESATYSFMVQLALSDVQALIGIVLGPGALMVANAKETSVTFVKIFAFCNGCGFRGTVFWMVLVAMSRWGYFSNKITVQNLFNRKNRVIICVIIWISMHIWYSPFLFYPNAFVALSNDSGAYSYTNETPSQIIKWGDECLNYLTLILQLIFNGMSWAIVWRMRKQMMTPELKARTQQEVKLLVQCGIDSLIYFLLILLYSSNLYFLHSDNPVLSVIMETLFLGNHVDCAVLYVCFNRQLRVALRNVFKKMFDRKQQITVVPFQTIRSESAKRASNLGN